jgi:hypothetical protein
MSTPHAILPADRPTVDLIEAIIRDAHFLADLTADFLERTAVLPPLKERQKTPVALPREFVLELGAILRLALWEGAGFRDCLGPDLPAAESALHNLLACLASEPHEPWASGDSQGLARVIFRIALCRLAWAGRAELHADVVLDEPDDDFFLKQVAAYLWAHRHAGAPGTEHHG